MLKKLLFSLLLLLLCFILTTLGDTPRIISYQARISNSSGEPLSGPHTFIFRLYESAGAPESDFLWEEVNNDTLNVSGLYKVMLGKSTPFPDSVDFSKKYWLGVSIDGGSEITRYQLGASPYSIRAHVADSIAGGFPDDNIDTTVAYWSELRNVPSDIEDGDDKGFRKLNIKDEAWLDDSVTFKSGDNVTLSQHSDSIIISSDDNQWSRSSTRLYPRNSSDIIGIGTTTPQQRLDINGGIRIGNTGSNIGGSIRYTGTQFQGYVADSGWTTLTGGNVTYDTTNLWAQTGRYVHLSDASDSVGIGTDAPFNKLDVNGAVAIGENYAGMNNAPSNGLIIEGNTGVGTAVPTEKLDIAGNVKISGGINDGSGIGDSGHLLSSTGSEINWVDPGSILDGDWQKVGSIVYTIDTRTVGIGISSPAAKLHVNGNQIIEGDLSLNNLIKDNYGDEPAESQYLTLDSVGNLSWKDITTSSSTYLNSLSDVDTTGLNDDQVLTWDASIDKWTPASNGSEVQHWERAGNYLHLYRSDDSVGIGASSPSEKLHISGNLMVEGGFNDGSGLGNSGQILTSDGAGGWSWEDAPSGVSSLPALSDVDTAGVDDGQVLKWVEVAGEWRPANDVGGSTGADDWGTQVVLHDSSLVGEGTAASPLGINWDTLDVHIRDSINLGDIHNVNDVGVGDGELLTWVEAAGEWRPTELDSGGLGDNWGTQIVESDSSLHGDGTEGDQLSVNWDTLGGYADTLIQINDLKDVNTDSLRENFVLGWDHEDSTWIGIYDDDNDMNNELIDSVLWQPSDSSDTNYRTLRIVEHGVEWDANIPVNKDSLQDNTIFELADVDSSGLEEGQLMRWTVTGTSYVDDDTVVQHSWIPTSAEDILSQNMISDLGDVSDSTAIDGHVLQWDSTTSNWAPGIDPSEFINVWQNNEGYISPLADSTIADFRIYDFDSTYASALIETTGTASGTWYGMKIDRRGIAESDGYGLYSYAGTDSGISAGSEFYGVKGEAGGGNVVYGVYGDGDYPGAGGIGYGVYGRGKTYGVYGKSGSNFAGYFEGPKSYFSGNVGIGTTSPTSKLDVNGQIKASGRIKDQTGFVMPVGTVVPYAGDSAPEGWLLCNGSSKSTSTYSDLFSVLGYAYGGYGGSFNLPDLRGRIPVGKSYDSEFNSRGETGGEKHHTLTTGEMPSHDHGGSTYDSDHHNHDMYFDDGGGGSGGTSEITVDHANCGSCTANGSESTSYDGSHSHAFTTDPKGGGSSHNNIQPYQVINYIIKY